MPAAVDPDQARKEMRKRRVARVDGLLLGVLSQLKPGDLAVDCGANVGAITSRLASTGADVIAFEPDPVAFDALKQATGAFDNVSLECAAVGIEYGQATLFRGEGFDNNPIAATRRSTILPGANRMTDTDQVHVELIDLPARLSQWISDRGEVAFLKLDIEGAELDILTEMLRLNLFENVRMTVAELHGYKFPAFKQEFKALRETLGNRYPKSRVFLDWI